MKVADILNEGQTAAEKTLADMIMKQHGALAGLDTEERWDYIDSSEYKDLQKKIALKLGTMFRAIFETRMKRQGFFAEMDSDNSDKQVFVSCSLDTYEWGDRDVEDLKKDTEALAKKILGNDAKVNFTDFGKAGESSSWQRYQFDIIKKL